MLKWNPFGNYKCEDCRLRYKLLERTLVSVIASRYGESVAGGHFRNAFASEFRVKLIALQLQLNSLQLITSCMIMQVMQVGMLLIKPNCKGKVYNFEIMKVPKEIFAITFLPF